MREIKVEQGSIEWLQARVGKITGTRLCDVLGSTKARKALIHELIAEELTNTFADSYTSASMERGTVEEPFAVKEYEKRKKIKTHAVGFIVGDNGFTGLSPDRLVKEKKVYIGALEVKNPDSSTHIEYLLSDHIPAKYQHQVLWYFIMIPTLQWLDFASYDSRNKVEPLKMKIIRVTRAELVQDLEHAERELESFRKEWVETLESLTF